MRPAPIQPTVFLVTASLVMAGPLRLVSADRMRTAPA